MAKNNFGSEDFEGFTYLDYNNVTVCWNIARGSFCSPSELPNSEYKNSMLSIAFAGMLSNSSPERLNSELAIDNVRVSLFPKCVSRLRGFFVFDEIESISRFWECNSWGAHFSDQYLSDVGVAATRSTRVDSNWISKIINANGTLKDDWLENTISYWSGDVFPGSEPIWERIVEGYLTVWSAGIRIAAALEVNAIWPSSFKLLQYSSLCAAYGSVDGMIVPFMMKDEKNNINIKYISQMKHANDDSFLKEIIDNANKIPQINIGLHAEIVNNDSVKVPDLTNFNVSLTSDDNDSFSDFVRLINKNI